MDEADTELVQYSNGALADPETGRIVSMSLSPEHAREMARARWDAARQAASDGMTANFATRRNLSPTNVTEYDAYASMIARQYDLAVDWTDKNANASVRAAEFVARAADLIPDQRRQDVQMPHGAGATVTLSPDIAARLLEILANKSQE